jgi:ribosome biogenesis GTPase
VLPNGALLIDTPGLRELQLWDGDVDEAFADIAALAGQCRFNDCGHQSEPGCAVNQAVASGALQAARLSSYRKLQRELAAMEGRHDHRVRRELKRRWRQRARETRHERRYGNR